MFGGPKAGGSLGGLVEIIHLLKKCQRIHLGRYSKHTGMAHHGTAPAVRPHNMIIRPAVEPVLLSLCAHRFVSDLRHVYAARLTVDSPHAFFLEREFLRIPR